MAYASISISEAKRKGPLGSYYAVSDYTKVNPEFGSIEDFRILVKTIHDNDMFVILDWVPNHTGWDHHWIANHPDFIHITRQVKLFIQKVQIGLMWPT